MRLPINNKMYLFDCFDRSIETTPSSNRYDKNELFVDGRHYHKCTPHQYIVRRKKYFEASHNKWPSESTATKQAKNHVQSSCIINASRRNVSRAPINLLQAQLLMVTILAALSVSLIDCISVKPSDFQRYLLPCYTGIRSTASSVYNNNNNNNNNNNQQSDTNPTLINSPATSQQQSPVSYTGGLSRSSASQYNSGGNTNQQTSYQQQQQPSASSFSSNNYQQRASNYNSDLGQSNGVYDGGLVLGQRLPHGQTIENFVEILSKIESNHPRLANNLDQFIRMILSRFHYDNYYYDKKSNGMSNSNDKDIRSDINELLLNPSTVQQQQHIVSDMFNEQSLTDDEKCSMYFMLSHHIEKEYLQMGTTLKGPQRPLSDNQQYGLLPVVRNNPGSNPFPALQASAAQSGAPSRYPGPAPGFGSAGANGPTYSANNQPNYQGNNPFGMNSQFPTSPNQYSSNYVRPNSGGSAQGGPIYPPPNSQLSQQQQLLQAQQNANRQKVAYEFGVVAVGNQDNSGVVLSRVLLGILAASQPSQPIRQLAASIYPNFDLSGTTKRVDEEIDPLFAVTLTDLWAISADHKKPLSQIVLGDDGHWNNTMCPTSFKLDRSESIKFTTAELNGGLDGFNLGRALRGIMEGRHSIKLSDLLRMYYSRAGFKPQFPDIGVCQRGAALQLRQEELKIQAENYLRLYDLKSPEQDMAVVFSITQMDSFRDVARRAAVNNIPHSICDESTTGDMMIGGTRDDCEISKADVVSIVDVSPQANEPFMEQCIVKVSNKIDMWKHGSTMTVLTNQMDSTGYGSSYNFNELIKNTSNPTLIGCALLYDRSRTFQGGAITEPVRLVEMFEQTLVSMTEGRSLERGSQQQTMPPYNGGQSSSYSSYGPTPYTSRPYNGQNSGQQFVGNRMPKNTGSSKSIIWFNYGAVARPQTTNSFNDNPYSTQEGSSSYRFKEAKRLLGENFRGATILAVGPNNEDLNPFVFDQRDIFSQAPAQSNTESYADSLMSGQWEGMSGPAEQLADQLVKRICEAPATFEYPNCYRSMSDKTVSTGYISPGKKQYWMMDPRTFFASTSIKMSFKVDGGRLRVCFGREPRPDETALSNGLPFGSGGMSSAQTAPTTSNYNLGKTYGVCKEVAPGQEIEFIVDDPCYKENIATCKPFYFVVKELGQPGEQTDPNWICRDEGCKRMDQVRFTLLHTGITCSSAFKMVAGPSPILVFGSIIYALWFYYKNLFYRQQNY